MKPDHCHLCKKCPMETGATFDYVAKNHEGEEVGVCTTCADALRVHRDLRDFVEMQSIGDLRSAYADMIKAAREARDHLVGLGGGPAAGGRIQTDEKETAGSPASAQHREEAWIHI